MIIMTPLQQEQLKMYMLGSLRALEFIKQNPDKDFTSVEFRTEFATHISKMQREDIID